MTFDVRVVFSGICLFVPNKDAKNVKVCGVIPDGRGEEIPGTDPPRVYPPLSQFYNGNKYLRRHAAMVTCRESSYVGSYEEWAGLWYLHRHRVWFKTEGGSNAFQYVPDTIANLGDFIPGYNINQKAVDDSGAGIDNSAQGIVSQVLLSEGRLEGLVTPKQTWAIPNTLSRKDPPEAKALSHLAFLSWEKIDTFHFKMKPIDDPSAPVRTFSFALSSGVLEIVIANLCDENPMRWPGAVADPSEEKDFEWYYELLTDQEREKLRLYLRGLPLPIPYPYGGHGNGRGVNCIPARTEDLSFDLDKHIIEQEEELGNEHE